jgi:hypothetical protein
MRSTFLGDFASGRVTPGERGIVVLAGAHLQDDARDGALGDELQGLLAEGRLVAHGEGDAQVVGAAADAQPLADHLGLALQRARAPHGDLAGHGIPLGDGRR